MEITQTAGDGILDVRVEGRLDGYWADHLDRALTDVVRQGHHHVRLDCSALSFLSSAGIAVLVKFHKELARVSGASHGGVPARRTEQDGTGFDIYELARAAPLTCRTIGKADPLSAGAFLD